MQIAPHGVKQCPLAPIQLPPEIAVVAILTHDPAILVVHGILIASASGISAQLANLPSAGVAYCVDAFVFGWVESLSLSAVEVFYRVAHVRAFYLNA
jgi:hypothetical protein